jgi:hypothetical protein
MENNIKHIKSRPSKFIDTGIIKPKGGQPVHLRFKKCYYNNDVYREKKKQTMLEYYYYKKEILSLGSIKL